MRIEFITQDDPLYILPLFEEFFRSYAGRWTITSISTCPTMGSRSRRQLISELIDLYGPGGFLRLSGRMAAARVLGAIPLGQGRNYFSMGQLARAYGIDLRPVGNPNAASFVEDVRRRGSDLIVSVACPYILKAALLSIPRLGCINIHHAPLPRYKGMMPTFWQMYHGEKTVGLTIHQMAPKVDEGAALIQDELPIHAGETLDHLIRRSKRHAAHCLAKVLSGIEDPIPTGTEKSAGLGTYFTFPTHAQISEFRRRGLRAI